MFTNPAPLAQTVNELRGGRHSLSLYLEQQMMRLEQVEPHVQALLPEPDRAVRLAADAAALRARFPLPAARPPLYGALLGIKDIFHADGFVTYAGSALPPELFAGPEAVCVTRLRDAGALILGKTVTTEFAYFEPGPTRNPHNLLHTPGGSSSGSAAAVAAGLCPLALGTQTIGSVIRPAAYCGVVGFKPTYDRIPTPGLVYFSRTVDHVGLFTQDVAGMMLAASVACNEWSPRSLPQRLPVLGVPDGPYLHQAEPEALAEFEKQLLILQARGATIKRVPVLEDIEALNALHRRLAFGEFAREHAAFYPAYKELYRPRSAEIIEIGLTVGDDELAELGESCATRRVQLEATMERAGLDLWACPAAPGPAPRGIESTGDPNMNLPWTHAGMPAITLPAGVSQNDLPLGLQLVARYGEDEALLAWTQQIGEMMGEG
ncbi:MAG: amidase [Caldilineaceae bacterium]|nr:amidase [Caldilineaceae bacterium]